MYLYDEEEDRYIKNTTEHITDETPSDYTLSLTDDACSLIPLYIASQLYKDDDISQATAYRNEFEVGLQDLIYNIENQTTIKEVL